MATATSGRAKIPHGRGASRHLAKILREHGFTGEFLYASKIGFPEERLSDSSEEMASLPDEYLSLILARKQKLE